MFDLSDLFNYITNIPFKLLVYKLISSCNLFSLTYCDWLFVILGYALFFNDYLWCSYSLILNFILKIFIFFVFSYIYIFFILIKSNKQVNTTDPFNKLVGLGLKNLDPFNKHVGLVLTYVVEYSWLDTRTQIATPTQ